MSAKKKIIGLTIATGILIVLLLGGGFFTQQLYSEKNEMEASLTEEKNQVMADLDKMVKQYETAIAENDIVNQDLLAAKERIQGLMDSLEVSQNNVNSLWRYKKRYFALEKEMDLLLKETDRLKVENKLLATSLDSTQVELNEKLMLSDSLQVHTTELEDVIKDAAVLEAVGLKGFGVIEKRSGELIPTERARRSDKIKVCYTVPRNALVEAEDVEYFLQVIDPNSNVIGENNKVKFDSQELNYSTISSFSYQNKTVDVCEFITPSAKSKFEKGRYIVNLFSDKALISQSEFTLR